MSQPTRAAILRARRTENMIFTFRLDYLATCPFCLAALPGRDVMFHRHLALCGPCWRSGARVSRRWLHRVRFLQLNRHFTTVAGLSFFIPGEGYPPDVALHQALGLVELSPVCVDAHRHRPEPPAPPPAEPPPNSTHAS